MSNKKRRNRKEEFNLSELKSSIASLNPTKKIDGDMWKQAEETADRAGILQPAKAGIFAYLKTNIWLVAVICFLALGTLGAGLKYLDDEAQREIARRNTSKINLNNQQDGSFLNKINPFLPSPTPTPTPQLSKELIYAGSRLLAVEDANASAAPADLAIWRPTTGEWWVMGVANVSQQVTQAWGANGDDPVEGDYDGDGKTDFAVFRPTIATWYIINSGGGGGQFVFGTAGDKPAPADYDGDGRTDAAVYRPSTGTWYILYSSNQQVIAFQFGISTDLPAPADYDSDGKADIAVWRNSETQFYLRTGPLSYETVLIGDAGVPVSGDYDGDGKADFAVYKASTAYWYINQSSNNQLVSYQWGAANDKPVQNDYDGDGKVDIAVWRDSNGNWYIRKSGSSGALRQEQWGASGDVPVPALYRR